MSQNIKEAASKVRRERRRFFFSTVELMIAFRYLRARRKEAFISVTAVLSFLGIMIGVTALIVVMAAMNGLRSEIINKLVGAKGHIILQPLGSAMTDYPDLIPQLEKIEGIQSAVPSVEGQAFVIGPYNSSGAIVKGIDQSGLEKIPALSQALQPDLISGWNEGEPGIILGDTLAQNLGVAKGETLSIISPDGDETPFGTSTRTKSYKVKGIFHLGQGEIDGFYIMMPLYESQLFFNKVHYIDHQNTSDDQNTNTDHQSTNTDHQDTNIDPQNSNTDPQNVKTIEALAAGEMAQKETLEVSRIEIYTHDPQQTEPVSQRIRDQIERPLIIRDWRILYSTYLVILQVERVTMFIILSLIIVVAVFNIISGLFMLVKDKAKDVAILRTMGATQAMIMKIFFLTGSAIGVLGTLCGLGLGLLIASNLENVRLFFERITGVPIFPPDVFNLDAIPSRIDLVEVTVIVVVACLLSFLATLYPSRKAASLDPIEVLRYE